MSPGPFFYGPVTRRGAHFGSPAPFLKVDFILFPFFFLDAFFSFLPEIM